MKPPKFDEPEFDKKIIPFIERDLKEWEKQRAQRHRLEDLDIEIIGDSPFVDTDTDEKTKPPSRAAFRAAVRDTEKYVREAALQGDTVPLMKLILPNNPSEPHLSASTRRLACWVMLDMMAAKKLHRVGRPKMTEEDRREKYPVHDAADEVELVIVPALGKLYPDQSTAALRKRAVAIATKRYAIQPSTLNKHITRSVNDARRRLRRG